MKRLLLLLLVGVFLPGGYQAQTQMYVAAGFNVGAGGFRNANFVVDRYNETRSYLSEQMGHVSAPMGLSASGGLVLGQYLVALNLDGRRRHTFAEGVDASGLLTRRDLRMRYNTYSAAFGYQPMENLPLHAGLSMDIGSQKFWTRVGPSTDIRDYKYFSPDYNTTFGVSLFAQYRYDLTEQISLLARPQFHFSLTPTRTEYLNAALNPGTYAADAAEDLQSRPVYIGITLQASLHN